MAIWGACLALAAVLVGWLLIALYTGVWPQRPRFVVMFLLASVALVFGATIIATLGHVRHAQERVRNQREREESERKHGVEKAPP
ncbi:hypothetical protein C1280_11925 [Gemmata obscuriglobus]|uniref:Uncharacterized protein n=1 Tax=Gemmata obscuriglobus TaxID=114 RepID=A0A2Z3GYA3_9BACT|nr:hypothetical protein C1280_11925 [Gemmata obscuriglobus]